MAKAWKQYTKEMAVKFGYLAAWEPGVPLALGDIGTLRQNRFTRLSNVKNLGVPFKIRKDPTATQLSHASSGKVSITFKAAGKPAIPGSVLTEAKAGVTIEFSKENATVFEAKDCTSSSIEDQIALATAILDLYKKGSWQKDWVVVTELVTCASATILISASKSGKVEISAAANVNGASFNIGDASLGLIVEFMSNMHTKIVGDKALTPLLRARGIKGSQPLNPFYSERRLLATDLAPADVASEQLYLGDVGFDLSMLEEDEELGD